MSGGTLQFSLWSYFTHYTTTCLAANIPSFLLLLHSSLSFFFSGVKQCFWQFVLINLGPFVVMLVKHANRQCIKTNGHRHASAVLLIKVERSWQMYKKSHHLVDTCCPCFGEKGILTLRHVFDMWCLHLEKKSSISHFISTNSNRFIALFRSKAHFTDNTSSPW